MAKTIEQMNKWSYKKAFKYFTESDRDRIILDAQNYIASLNKMVPLVDFRKEKDASMAINKIKGSIGKNTLVLIDGASANGKTTFAERLASKIDAEIVDVDKLCTNYFRNIMLGPATILEKKRGAANMGQDITDEYILNNLEWIIEEKSKGNRPVILIGMYLKVIYRSLVVKCFGRYFKDGVVSIFMHANTFEDVKKLIDSRIKEFDNMHIPNEVEDCKKEYDEAGEMLNAEGKFLGIGMNASFLVNTRISDALVK